MHAATLLQPLKTKHCGSLHYIKIGDSRLRTVTSAAGLWGWSPLYLIVLGVSHSRVLAQRPTGCCSARISTSPIVDVSLLLPFSISYVVACDLFSIIFPETVCLFQMRSNLPWIATVDSALFLLCP